MMGSKAATRNGATAVTSGRLDPDSAEARIGRAWRDLRRGAAMQAMRDRLYGDLLEPAQVDALDAVLERDGCRMSELAEALRVDASTATRAVNRLEQAGLVERVAAAGDGRGVRVVATGQGLGLWEELNVRRRAMLFGVLEDFAQADRAELAELLERLVAGIDDFVIGPPA